MIKAYEEKDLNSLLNVWYAASQLDVFKDNLVGQRFYEAYGFRPVTEHVHEETGFVQLRLRLDGLG